MINSLFKMTDYGRYASIPGSVIRLNTFLVIRLNTFFLDKMQ